MGLDHEGNREPLLAFELGRVLAVVSRVWRAGLGKTSTPPEARHSEAGTDPGWRIEGHQGEQGLLLGPKSSRLGSQEA